MILLREIELADVDALMAFSEIPGFINLPSDRDLLQEKAQRSNASFRDLYTDKCEAKYLFIAEDLKDQRILGTSMIAAQHGTPERPHFFFQVGTEEKFSKSVNMGFIHGTLTLAWDTDGPSELGGLVIHGEHRNSPTRIGRQISFVRFLYLAMNRSKFRDKLLAELLPPFNRLGQAPLWEAIGRRFTGLNYWEADQLSQLNKELILSLFPTGKIYTTFLPPDARSAIGKVSPQTEPVLHMLKKVGFRYQDQIDPFDGGPHLWADVDSISLLKGVREVTFQKEPLGAEQAVLNGVLAKRAQTPGTFRALSVEVRFSPDSLSLQGEEAEEAVSILGLQNGDPVVFMPYY